MLFLKIAKRIGTILQTYTIFLIWLLVVLAMVSDYYYRVNNPPTGFIPSSYDPPNATLVVILLAIMVAELSFTYLVLRPWQREARIVRVVLLSIFNLLWMLFSAFISGTRSPNALLWHFGWLLLLEIILFLDIAIFSIGSLIHFLCRAIVRN